MPLSFARPHIIARQDPRRAVHTGGAEPALPPDIYTSVQSR